MSVTVLFDGTIAGGAYGSWVEVPESSTYMFSELPDALWVQFSLDGVSMFALKGQPKQINDPLNVPVGGSRVAQMTGYPVKYMRVMNVGTSDVTAKVNVLG